MCGCTVGCSTCNQIKITMHCWNFESNDEHFRLQNYATAIKFAIKSGKLFDRFSFSFLRFFTTFIESFNYILNTSFWDTRICQWLIEANTRCRAFNYMMLVRKKETEKCHSLLCVSERSHIHERMVLIWCSLILAKIAKNHWKFCQATFCDYFVKHFEGNLSKWEKK